MTKPNALAILYTAHNKAIVAIVEIERSGLLTEDEAAALSRIFKDLSTLTWEIEQRTGCFDEWRKYVGIYTEPESKTEAAE